MKYCSRPFDFLYLDHYNGDVCLCPWIDPQKGKIGNILEQSFEEIWYGEKAEALRDTVRKGSFDYCRRVACPRVQNDDLEDRDVSGEDYIPKAYPETVNMAFDFVCNQSCPTCRCEVFVPDKNYKGNVDEIIKRLLPILSKAKMITASGHGDPFASPYMMEVLEKLQPESSDCHILLETNGVFLDEAHWERIKHLASYNFEIVETTNSYYEPIYNQISKGGNLEKLKKNQVFLKKLRSEGYIRHTTNCMVIQEKNYIEIPEFIEKSLDTYGFDEVVLKPIYNWGNLTEEEFWFKDVLNPLHPYNEEYKKIINLPIVKDNPKVYNFGGTTMHKPSPMPGAGGMDNIRNRAQANFLKRFVLIDDVEKVIMNNLNGYDLSYVMIYGAAEIGRAINKTLKKMNISVKGFVDEYISDKIVDGVPVFRINDDSVKKSTLVIVSTLHIFDEVSQNVRKNNDVVCVSAEELVK